MEHGAWYDAEKHARRQRPATHDSNVADPVQDVPDESAFGDDWIAPGTRPYLLLHGPKGAAEKMAVYCRDVGYVGRAVLDLDQLLGLCYDTREERDREHSAMRQDVLLMRVIDRFYFIDHVVEWSVDWGVKALAALQLQVGTTGPCAYRVSPYPTKMASEFVTLLDSHCESERVRAVRARCK